MRATASTWNIGADAISGKASLPLLEEDLPLLELDFALLEEDFALELDFAELELDFSLDEDFAEELLSELLELELSGLIGAKFATTVVSWVILTRSVSP